jgi:RND family efflux transporter MFP subunit
LIRKDQPIFRLTPLVAGSRDMEITAQAELGQARTRLETARMRKARADKMLADEVGTVRAVEEAQQEVELAATAVQAAETRLKQIQSAPLDADVQMVVRVPEDGILRQVFVASGQTLSAGAPLFEVADLRSVWIRVPVYAGEASTLVANSPVTVQTLSGGGRSWTAQPVTAPPSGDPVSSTIHLYFQMSNPGQRFRPGEKVMVTIRGAGSRDWLTVPQAAIVFDTQGGTWVYESLGERRYARRRVDVDRTVSSTAYLGSGIAAGTRVVTDGAAELWGFEFGTGK